MKKTKAQSVIEYSICVAMIIFATIAVQHYIRRGLQGRYANMVDFTTNSTAEKAGVSPNLQYEPEGIQQELNTTQSVEAKDNIVGAGKINRVILSDKSIRKGTSTETIK